ncbi:MAG: YbhN family protein, partial [Candidatus Caldatribacteriota bacterium]
PFFILYLNNKRKDIKVETIEKPVLNRNKIIKGLIISLLIGITAFLLIFFITIDKNTIISLKHMEKEFLLLAAAAIFLSVFIEGLRIQVVAGAVGEKIAFWESVKIFYISSFLGSITPYFSGTIPGQVFLFQQQGISIAKGFLIATIRPIMKSIIFLIITPLLFFYFQDSLQEYEVLSWLLLIMAIGFSIIVILAFVLVVSNPQKVESLLIRLKDFSFLSNFFQRPTIQKILEGIISQVRVLQESYHLLLNHPREIILAFFYTFLYWFCYFSVAPLLLLALEMQLDFALVIALQVLIFFLLPFLPTPGGSGAAEVGFASLFSFFVPAHLLGIYVGGWRLFTFYLNMLIGALLSLNLLKDWIVKKDDS